MKLFYSFINYWNKNNVLTLTKCYILFNNYTIFNNFLICLNNKEQNISLFIFIFIIFKYKK